MKHIVYKTTNLINNRIYIGIHKQVDDTFDGYLGSGVDILKDIDNYGTDKFERETLYSYTNRKDALNKESELVTWKEVHNPKYYNRVPGGGDPPKTTKESYRKSLETKKLIYGNKVGNLHSEEARIKSMDTKIKNMKLTGKVPGFNLHTEENKLKSKLALKDKYGESISSLNNEEVKKESFRY